MAIPKKGSRKIVVNDITYSWLIRRKATYGQVDYGYGKLHVAIELFDKPESVLVIITDNPHPHDIKTTEIISVTPQYVEKWIQEALDLGWKPFQNGPQFHVIIEDGIMKIKK
jgi:hypothetical protein